MKWALEAWVDRVLQMELVKESVPSLSGVTSVGTSGLLKPGQDVRAHVGRSGAFVLFPGGPWFHLALRDPALSERLMRATADERVVVKTTKTETSHMVLHKLLVPKPADCSVRWYEEMLATVRL
jgi:hypothetical protein